MMGNRKKDLLLDKIIQGYIESQEPIGSETLKMSMSIKISSATIRNYFKILSNEGVLTQTHISSGRIPTSLALKNYWRSRLNCQGECLQIDVNKFENACEKNGIFGLIKKDFSQTLQKVINHENEYLILVFEEELIALPFHQTLERFSKELVGLNLEDIKKIAHQVCANTLCKKLSSASQKLYLQYFGVEFLSFLLQYKDFQKLFFEIIEGRIFEKLDNGVYFDKTIPNGSLAIVQNIKLDEKEAKMFCMGELNKNYESFYEEIAS